MTSSPVSNKSNENLFAWSGGWAHYCLLHHAIISLTSNLWPTSPAQVLKTAKRLESGDCLMDCSLAELQFFGQWPFWIPLFMQCNNFWRLYNCIPPFLSICSAAKLAIIFIVFNFQDNQIVEKLILKGCNRSISYVTMWLNK